MKTDEATKKVFSAITSDYLRNAQMRVEIEIDKRQVSKSYLAARIGVHRVTLDRYVSDVGTMPVTRFITLLSTLGVDPFTLTTK